MNDISQKRHAVMRGPALRGQALRSEALRSPALRGPVLAAVVFALAYGSAMVLVIAPRGLLGGSQSLAVEDGTVSGGAGSDQPQLLRAGFSPIPVDRSAYGIRD